MTEFPKLTEKECKKTWQNDVKPVNENLLPRLLHWRQWASFGFAWLTLRVWLYSPNSLHSTWATLWSVLSGHATRARFQLRTLALAWTSLAIVLLAVGWSSSWTLSTHETWQELWLIRGEQLRLRSLPESQMSRVGWQLDLLCTEELSWDTAWWIDPVRYCLVIFTLFT